MANAHCEDLLREARQAALAAEATGGTGRWWDSSLRLTAHVLLKAGHHVNAYLYDRRLGRTLAASHDASHAVSSRHQPNTGLRFAGHHGIPACCAIVPGLSGGHAHA